MNDANGRMYLYNPLQDTLLAIVTCCISNVFATINCHAMKKLFLSNWMVRTLIHLRYAILPLLLCALHSCEGPFEVLAVIKHTR